MLRDIIEIDEELCDGCGECVPSCAEGALAVIDGKLRVLDDAKCDGAGACIGNCSKGALRVVKRDAAPFDERFAPHPASPPAPAARLAPLQHSGSAHAHGAGGCPGSRAAMWDDAPARAVASAEQPSALRQWPVQLHLVSPNAPFWAGRHLLLCADCVPFSFGAFHSEMLAGKSLAIACPKLDDPSGYIEKLTAILSSHDVPSLTVAIMEVPCCRGLVQSAMSAARNAGYAGKLEVLTVSLKGVVIGRQALSI
ncbi:MAG: 4Fe-4S binding protein [Deltaproteobacteria bacterium]|nr:4Fe-4S binding protein [Deltaproteobacteria bacterium]